MSTQQTTPCVVRITDTKTETSVTYHDEWLSEHELSKYMWSEGNFSCDCNRRLFYNRTLDPCFEVDWSGANCGEGRYRVRITDGYGDVLYSDEQENV